MNRKPCNINFPPACRARRRARFLLKRQFQNILVLVLFPVPVPVPVLILILILILGWRSLAIADFVVNHMA